MLIDQPGTYQTRSGKKVTIHEIRFPPNYQPDCLAFPAKGSVWKTLNNIGNNPEYGIWTQQGKYGSINDHPLDIIEKL